MGTVSLTGMDEVGVVEIHHATYKAHHTTARHITARHTAAHHNTSHRMVPCYSTHPRTHAAPHHTTPHHTTPHQMNLTTTNRTAPHITKHCQISSHYIKPHTATSMQRTAQSTSDHLTPKHVNTPGVDSGDPLLFPNLSRTRPTHILTCPIACISETYLEHLFELKHSPSFPIS